MKHKAVASCCGLHGSRPCRRRLDRPSCSDLALAHSLTPRRPPPAPPPQQTWHWNEKRRIAEYYSELAVRETSDEKAYTAELRSKLKALEDELLA